LEFFVGEEVIGGLIIVTFLPKFELMGGDEVDEFRVTDLPALKAAEVVIVRFRDVVVDPREQLLEQAVAGHLKSLGRAFEALEELDADQGDYLRLTRFVEVGKQRIIRRAGPVCQRIVDIEIEERRGAVEGSFHLLKQAAIGGFEFVCRDLGWHADGEQDRRSAGILERFTLPHKRAAALHHDPFEKGFMAEVFIDAARCGFRFVVMAGGQAAFEIHEVASQAVDAEVPLVATEVGVILMRHQFENPPEIVDGVVDGGGGEEEQPLRAGTVLMDVGLQLAITGGGFDSGACDARVAEVMGFIDENDVRIRNGAGKLRLEVGAGPLEIGVIVKDHVHEARTHIWHLMFDGDFPDILAGGFWREKDNAFSFLEPDFERGADLDVTVDGAQHIRGHILRLIPVTLIPRLKNSHFRAADLDIQLDILDEAGCREIRRADQCEGANDRGAAMGDVAFGVELVLTVNPAFDFPAADAFDNRRNAGQKIVFSFLGLEAPIKQAVDFSEAFLEGALGILRIPRRP